jgi:hypothetical protein
MDTPIISKGNLMNGRGGSIYLEKIQSRSEHVKVTQKTAGESEQSSVSMAKSDRTTGVKQHEICKGQKKHYVFFFALVSSNTRFANTRQQAKAPESPPTETSIPPAPVQPAIDAWLRHWAKRRMDEKGADSDTGRGWPDQRLRNVLCCRY